MRSLRNIAVALLFLSCLLLKVSVAAADTFVDTEPFPIPSKAEKAQQRRVEGSHSVAISPMVGSAFSGDVSASFANQYTLGAIVELPVLSLISVEIEGTYGRFVHRNSYQRDFNQFTFGAGGKFYLIRQAFIRPYVGLGLAGIYYDEARAVSDASVVGNMQAAGGAEASVSNAVALGGRGEYLVPVSAKESKQFRMLGTVKVAL